MNKRNILVGLCVFFLGLSTSTYASDTEVILDSDDSSSSFIVKDLSLKDIFRVGGGHNVHVSGGNIFVDDGYGIQLNPASTDGPGGARAFLNIGTDPLDMDINIGTFGRTARFKGNISIASGHFLFVNSIGSQSSGLPLILRGGIGTAVELDFVFPNLRTNGTTSIANIGTGPEFAPITGNAKLIGLNVAPTVNQTGTANGGYTAIQANVTETSFLGSDGRLLDLQVGGISKMYVDNNGEIFQRGASIHADYVFDSHYKLESIHEHAEFMWKNNHITAIPKAKKD